MHLSVDVPISRARALRPGGRPAPLAPLALLLLATLAWTAPASAFTADSDQDGVNDAFDNCTLTPNPLQQDTNGDGFGNACDADLDGDGRVASRDFFSGLRPCLGKAVADDPGCADADMDGDGVVSASDFFSVMRPSLGGQPGPGNPDADADGLPNVTDSCPQSPPGASVDAAGCSSGDLVLDPQKAVTPVLAPLETLLAVLVEQGSLSEVQAALQDARTSLFDVSDRLGRAEFCSALDPATEGTRDIQLARGVLLALIKAKESEKPPQVPVGGEADITEAQSEAVAWSVRLADLDGVQGELTALRGRVQMGCKDLGPPDAVETGQVAAFDEARGVVELMDPKGGQATRTLVLSRDFLAENDLYPGRLVEFHGAVLGDGSFVAKEAIGVGAEGAIDPSLSYIECIRFRIAPVQPALSVLNYSGQPELHHPDAYLGNTTGKLLLEKGMGIGAVDAGCAPATPPKFVRNSFKVRMQYRSTTGQLKLVTLASDLKPGQLPVPFPSDVGAGLGSDDAEIFLTYRHQSCIAGPFGQNTTCSEVVEQSSTTYTLRFLEKRGYCIASYEDTTFELEDDDFTSFGRTRISSKFVFAEPDPGTNVVFNAKGYYSSSPSSSTYPTVQTVGESQYFAVYNHDFYTDPNVLFPEATYGVTSASALAWPRATGLHNGQVFAYSCRLPPTLVRDRIDVCSVVDSYYRLPFYPGYPVWTLSQGNNGSFTHNGKQAYAFDFVSPANTPIRAARGGRVVFVRENQTGNSYDNPGCSNCAANAVVIRHQDGSEAAYFHMPTNGVNVSLNQKVKRGATIAKVGNIGYSTGPHLHFQAQYAGSGGQTLPSRFETGNHSCFIPPSNTSDLISNNN